MTIEHLLITNVIQVQVMHDVKIPVHGRINVHIWWLMFDVRVPVM